jgi:hypothetical protein
MVTITTLQLWSEKQQKVITYQVKNVENEADVNNNKHSWIELVNPDDPEEVLKYSPSYTDQSLQAYARKYNNEKLFEQEEAKYQ